MSQPFNVNSFLEQLHSATPQARSNEPRQNILTYIHLAVESNFGKYQVFPMISEVTGNPYTYLYRTREINIPRKGTQDQFKWHKILPVNAYQFVDSTGRLVSSLTSAETDLLTKAQGIFDTLNDLFPESMGDKKKKDLMRVKDYTIFNAYVINKYGEKDLIKPERSKFPALFVCTSKKFAGEITKDIQMQSTNYGGNEFITQVYNRELSNRTGWLVFTIGKETQGFGYRIGVSHAANLAQNVSGIYTISQEEADAMKDPVKNFLGFQAGDKPNMFNQEIIEYEIEEMSKLIARVNSASVAFNASSVSNAQVNTAMAQQAPSPVYTPDPIVAKYQQEHQNVAPQQTMSQTQDQISSNNTDVYSNPPAAQIDPVTGAPVNYGQAPQPSASQFGYSAPSFANPQDQQGQIQNPFLTAQENPFKR